MNYFKQTLKHASVYCFVSVLQKGVGLFMIPVYTHYLTPSDYGTLELLDLFMLVSHTILGMGLGAALVRFYHAAESEREQNEVVSTALFSTILFAGFFLLVCQSSAEFIAQLILKDPDSAFFIKIISVSLFFQIILAIPENILIAKKKTLVFSKINVVTFLLYLTLNILFIAVLQFGVLGMLYSMLISKTLNTLILFISTRDSYIFKFSSSKMTQMASFGLPLIPSSLCMLVLHYSDRFFLQHFHNLDELGIYSLGYKFGMIISMLINQPLNYIWSPQRYEIAKEKNAPEAFGKIITYVWLILAFVGLGISIFSHEIITIMAPVEYERSSGLIALIVGAYILFGLSSFSAVGFFIQYKTRYDAMLKFITALANIVLNYFLVKNYGMYGAAVSTFLTFLIYAALNFYVSQKVFYIQFEYHRMLKIGLSALIIFVGSKFIDLDLLYSIIFKLCLLALFPFLLYLSKFFNETEIEKIQYYLSFIPLNPGWK
jgi:O-antigen/teichoic acid export membrane protein